MYVCLAHNDSFLAYTKRIGEERPYEIHPGGKTFSLSAYFNISFF